MKKAGIADVARLSGVSVSTVDRAINGREGVSLKNKRRVFDAIRELQYRDLGKLKQRTFGRPVRIKVLTPPIPLGIRASFDLAVRTMGKRMWDIDLKVISEEIPTSEDGVKFAARIDAVCPNADGLALIAPDTPPVRRAIDRAVERGIHVVTVLSDVPASKRHEFIGIDNRTAGKCAAALMAKSIGHNRGKILSLCGPNSVLAQSERHAGFVESLTGKNPNLRVSNPICLPDNNDKARQAMIDILAKNTDAQGIFLYGGGIDGGLAGICEMADSCKPTVIVHGLTSGTFRWLESGVVSAVIQQDMIGITHRVFVQLVNMAAGTRYETIVENSPIEIIIPENAESYRQRTVTGMPVE